MKKDIGLLLLRVGIGIMFIYHGLPKLLGGPETWAGVGKAMSVFGITFFPAFWGFMAAVSEFVGGIALVLGILMVPFCLLLFITMFVAASMHLLSGQGLQTAAHAIEAAIVFLSLSLLGPGKYHVPLKYKK